MNKVDKVKELVYQEFENCDKHGIDPTQLLEAFMIISYYLKQVEKEREIEIEDGDVLFRVTKNKVRLFDIRRGKEILCGTLKLV